MASLKLPFRPHFRTTSRGRAAEHVFRDLTRIQAGDHRTDRAFLEHVATTADESVAWTLVVKETELFANHHWYYEHSKDDQEWAKEAGRLLTQKAERILEEEGIVWSPLIDVLIQTGAWDTEAAPNGLFEKQRQIQLWLQRTEKPSELEPILVFGAGVILEMVGEFAKKLTWAQVDRLTNNAHGIRGLARNPAAILPHTQQLIAKGWSVCQEDSGKSAQHEPHRELWLRIFATLTTNGKSLPAEIRSSLLFEAEKPISDDYDSTHTRRMRAAEIAAIAADPALTSEELERIVALRPDGIALSPLMRAAAATLELHERLLDAQDDVPDEIWQALLDRYPELPARWLLRIIREQSYPSTALLRRIATHPNADADVWMALLDSRRLGGLIADDLVRHPVSLRLASVRQRIRDVATDGETVSRLLPHCVTGAEWKAAFLRLIELSPMIAARELSSGRVPADANIGRLDILPLLSSDVSEVRVAAVCALSSIQAGEVPERRERRVQPA